MNFNVLTFFIIFNISFFYLLNMHNEVTYGGTSDTGLVGSKPKTTETESTTEPTTEAKKKYKKAKKRYNRNIQINLIIYILFICASFIINTYLVYKFFNLNINIRSTLQNTLMLLAILMVIILIIILSMSDITMNDLKPNIVYSYKNTDNTIINLTNLEYGTRKLNMKQKINTDNNILEKFEIFFSLYVETGQTHDNYSYTEILNFGEKHNDKNIDFCKLALDHTTEELVLYIIRDISNIEYSTDFNIPSTDIEMKKMDSYYLKFTTPINMFYKWNDIQIKYNGSAIYVYINNLLVMIQPYYIRKIGDIYINQLIIGDDRITSMPGLIKDGIFIKQ